MAARRLLRRIGLAASLAGLPTGTIARAEVLAELPDKILSQCGLVSALLVVAVVYLSIQLAKTRAGWETDRGEWLKALTAQNTSHENLAVSNAKLEGILLAIQRTH